MRDVKPTSDEAYYKAYLEHQTISRRGLFTRIASGAKRSQHEQTPVMPRHKARPPHAQEEVLFVRLCNPTQDNLDTAENSDERQNCHACQTACPQQIIEIQAQRPVLNLDYNHCTHCGACIEACPSQALSIHAPQDNGLRPEFAKSCNNYTSGYCSACVQSCPQQALSHHDDNLPRLDSNACNGCGLCASSCYIQAVRLTFASQN